MYRFSFSKVSGFITWRSVEMLKKPGEPALSSGFVGTSVTGRVVRIEEGTSSLGARLKYVAFNL